MFSTLKGFASQQTLSGFYVFFVCSIPGLSLRSNPGLELANAFGVFKVNQHSSEPVPPLVSRLKENVIKVDNEEVRRHLRHPRAVPHPR
jgi:hypothetical protein